MALVKVFISHKREDSATATRVCAKLLSASDVDAYIDVWDPHISGSAEHLVAYVRRQLGVCTHLMVVMSAATQSSWWVPFEIGLATEKAYPISTFAAAATSLPEYLRKWPYLRSEADLEQYARVAKQTQPTILQKGLRAAATQERSSYASSFHTNLKRALGQP